MSSSNFEPLLCCRCAQRSACQHRTGRALEAYCEYYEVASTANQSSCKPRSLRGYPDYAIGAKRFWNDGLKSKSDFKPKLSRRAICGQS